jgi:hypothetical protein
VILRAKAPLCKHQYPDHLRTVLVAGLIDQNFEHHDALLMLLRNGKPGSAFALSRSIVEGVYRGLWLNFVASDAEVQAFEKNDELPINMTEVAKAIDAKYQARDFFEDLKKRSWSALWSYTHGGILQLGRRFTGHKMEP